MLLYTTETAGRVFCRFCCQALDLLLDAMDCTETVTLVGKIILTGFMILRLRVLQHIAQTPNLLDSAKSALSCIASFLSSRGYVKEQSSLA